MLAYTTYSEAGGVGKTTTAANLAVAHARAGLRPLVIGLDPQDGDISHLFGVDGDREREDVDTLVYHLIDRPQGEFEDLVISAEHGVDIVPEHNILSKLADFLDREKAQAEDMGKAFGTHSQLQRVVRETGIPNKYDVLICDPPATEGPHLYNAVDATRSLVIPVELTAKGEASVTGLEALVSGLESTLQAEIGVLAAVPTGYKDLNEQDRVLETLRYPAPEVIRERESLMGGSWRQQCSAFSYVQEHRDRIRDHEIDTLASFDRLARYLEEQVGLEAPHPPEPGAIDRENQEVSQ